MKRQIPLINGEIYHIVNRSISEYKIFNTKSDYLRTIQLLQYYQTDPNRRFSYFITLDNVSKEGFNSYLDKTIRGKERIVQIIAYCLMPTHIHLVLKQLKHDGISKYFGTILNSYTHYFNRQHKRKGPLWEAKFKNILVENDEQLLHLTRYIHLNPVTARLTNKPENWAFSSYREYMEKEKGVCEYQEILVLDPKVYRKFVNDRISYQRELAKIKAIKLD